MSNIQYATFCKTQSTDILTNVLLEQHITKENKKDNYSLQYKKYANQ